MPYPTSPPACLFRKDRGIARHLHACKSPGLRALRSPVSSPQPPSTSSPSTTTFYSIRVSAAPSDTSRYIYIFLRGTPERKNTPLLPLELHYFQQRTRAALSFPLRSSSVSCKKHADVSLHASLPFEIRSANPILNQRDPETTRSAASSKFFDIRRTATFTFLSLVSVQRLPCPRDRPCAEEQIVCGGTLVPAHRPRLPFSVMHSCLLRGWCTHPLQLGFDRVPMDTSSTLPWTSSRPRRPAYNSISA
ncbi:hypothetical protein EXIGLDRAFT_463352 [Exidia glandulosa HHB12029]|uniref:Uncharacterized protein n=1 Tax=Exidia glandulosa HHB12029 TaxID=1314781 RepID=A0A165AZX0_EXIGL|nr:hypothetical protein EXIGLDRAFT_463352 [Exidia glandulosa HHB12029]